VAFHAPHTPLDERGSFVDIPTQPDPANPDRWLNEDVIKWFNDPLGIIQSEPERDKRLLLAAVYHIDNAVGDLVKTLEETGQRDNTIIMFSSDNGPWRNNRGGSYPDNYPLENYNQPCDLRGKKLDVYQGGVKVAGFINWPQEISSMSMENYTHIVDWLPTLASIINYEPDENLNWDGIDLSPEFFGEGDLRDRDIYLRWHWPSSAKTRRRALRYGDWKIVNYGEDEPKSNNDWQLFNLVEDRYEKYNIAPEYPDITKDLHQRYLNNKLKDYKGELLGL
jgi:arylsulfatase A-like enzyme